MLYTIPIHIRNGVIPFYKIRHAPISLFYLFKNDLLVYKIYLYKPDIFSPTWVKVTINIIFSAILHGNIGGTSLNLRVKNYDHSFDGAMDEFKS